MISDGVGFTDEELQLTFVLDWNYPEVEAGSAEERQKMVEQRLVAKTAVEMTLKSVRGMIEKGVL